MLFLRPYKDVLNLMRALSLKGMHCGDDDDDDDDDDERIAVRNGKGHSNGGDSQMHQVESHTDAQQYRSDRG